MKLKGKSIEGFPLFSYNEYSKYELGGNKYVSIRNKKLI